MKFALTSIILFLFFSTNLQSQIISVGSYNKINSTTENFTGLLDNGDFFGGAVTHAGDINGDGIDDIMVGARHDSDTGLDRGAVWVLFMDETGNIADYQKINEIKGNFSGALTNDAVFGTDIANLGDLDGDGINDFAIGAPSSSADGNRTGEVWIVFLNSDGTVKEEQRISRFSGNFTNSGIGDNSRFGKSIDALGDLDGDGVTDMVVTGYLDSEVQFHQGAAWVILLNANGTVKASQKINAENGGFTGDLGNDEGFGYGVATLQDMDGDSIPEIAIGCRGDNDGGNLSGAVWILWLRADGTVKDQQKISATAGNFTGDIDAGDQFGCSVSNAGDLDNDGVDDLLVGSWKDDDGGDDKGAFWILLLNSDGTVKSHGKISATAGDFNANLDQDDFFSFALESVPDMNGDGIRDIIVGAKGDDDEGSDKGAIYIIYPINLLTSTSDYTNQNLLNIKVFPNPTYHSVNISIENEQYGKLKCTIFNQQGKEIISRNYQKQGSSLFETINVQNLANGTYTLSIEMNGTISSKSIIIAR